jgi:RNA polymerase sigma-70 factor (ECF subfamily)
MDNPWTTSSNDVSDALARHRPELLRHCYRMLGSFSDAEEVVQEVLLKAWRSRDTYAADAPIQHWLMRIATNTCLNALTRPGVRGLPQLDRAAAPAETALEQLEAAHWVTPAPDAKLLPGPAEAAETREAVAIAFIALLQRLPPKQRAVLLLKDVIGWSAEEIAAALELTVPSVNSALHRARETVATRPRGQVDDPPGDVLGAYVRSWEERDLHTLVALLKKDVVFSMPPYTLWLLGAEEVERFLRAPRFDTFWSRHPRGVPTRANGLPAVVWYGLGPDGLYRLHSLQVMRFEEGKVAEATTFIGASYLAGFELPSEMAFEPLTG